MAEPISTFLIFAATSFLLAALPVAVSYFLSPKIRDKEENIPYECGELPSSPARNLGFGYYSYAVIYLVFEVLSAFIFLFAVSIYNIISVFTVGMMASLFAILSLSLVYFYKEVKKIEV